MAGYFAFYCAVSPTKQHDWREFQVPRVHTDGTYCIYCWKRE